MEEPVAHKVKGHEAAKEKMPAPTAEIKRRPGRAGLITVVITAIVIGIVLLIFRSGDDENTGGTGSHPVTSAPAPTALSGVRKSQGETRGRITFVPGEIIEIATFENECVKVSPYDRRITQICPDGREVKGPAGYCEGATLKYRNDSDTALDWTWYVRAWTPNCT